MIPSEIWVTFFILGFVCLLLFGINHKFNTIERLNREYVQCIHQGNTEQICNKLYKS